MKHYEVLFIVKPTLTEDEAKKQVDFVKEVITKNGGEIASVQEMGTRRLAYAIKKYERGTYFVVYFIAPTELVSELVRNIRNNEDIIRFLTLKYETKQEVAAWDKLSKGIKFSPERKERKPRAERPKVENDNEITFKEEIEEVNEEN